MPKTKIEDLKASLEHLIGLLIIVCFFSCQAKGQSITKADLLEDLRFLSKAVAEGHPINYDKVTPSDLEEVVEEAEAKSSENLSALEYELWIRKALYEIGCVHTSLWENPLLEDPEEKSYLPLALAVRGKELIIIDAADSLLRGVTVHAINNLPADSISSISRRYLASDGVTEALSRAYFSYATAQSISKVLGYPNTYQVETSKGTLEFTGETKSFTSTKIPLNPIIENGLNKFYFKGGTPVLKMESFGKSDKKFLQDVFEYLANENSEALILDLRGNLGGSRKVASFLTSHLVSTPFSYSILQPKLSLRPYLDGKGKRFLLLSKLKYNVMSFMRGRKTDLGREFTYTNKPTKQNAFKGKLYILTDGYTASASTMVTSWAKQHTDAVFAGLQASGGYNGNNGGSFPTVTLPRSGIQVRFAAYRLILDPASKKEDGIVPDIPLTPGIDPTSDQMLEDLIRLIGED